jgi:hypothetical protein
LQKSLTYGKGICDLGQQAMSDNDRQVRDLSLAYLEFRASASIRSEFRAALERLKCRGYGIEWLEQEGWFHSLFVVRGRQGFLAAVQNAIVRKWAPRTSTIHLKRYNRGAQLDFLA